MKMLHLPFTKAWLRRHEVPAAGAGRRFQVSLGGEIFLLSVTHEPLDSAEAFTTPEEPRRVDDGECLEIIASMFLGSLPGQDGAELELDLRAGWEAYRRDCLETGGSPLPGYDQLPGQSKESFAAGVRAAMAGSGVLTTGGILDRTWEANHRKGGAA